ncbi:hypothetical protein HPB51_007148 [Rhipicephalus microplus]|uniref:Protein to be involved in spindle matrix formation n=1 Tax=Rhipicephalus microplus TaxID=6941 RepID=A0A9J6DZV7_RHIMP|nr:hypothetical protein HPB51_007148 [Rhipicephalus microplus]
MGMSHVRGNNNNNPDMVALTLMILLLVCTLVFQEAAASAEKPLEVWYLGRLDSGLHGIRGKVYAASGDTLVLRDFSYDGRAPGARFLMGRGGIPDGNSIAVGDDTGQLVIQRFLVVDCPLLFVPTVRRKRPVSYNALKAYRNQTLVLKLAPGKKITDFKWFGVFDRKAKRSFAHVEIPADLHLPRARTVATHLVGEHANASAIVIEDKHTLLIKDFYFDGSVPGLQDRVEYLSAGALKFALPPYSAPLQEPGKGGTFFLVGKGNKAGLSKGMKISDEKGSNSALGMYAGANLRLPLPENITVDDIDWFAVSCAHCTRPLVQGTMPKHIDVPVNLNARWIKKKTRQGRLRIRGPAVDADGFRNCETVYKDGIQVGWQLEADNITFSVRAVAAPNTWTAFGLSGADDKSQMVNADVAVISIIPPNNKIVVDDYFLTDRVQCSGRAGVCPDTAQSGTNDLKVKSSSFANGIVDVVYSRKLDTGDSKDKAINSRGPMAVVAAQGPLNEAQTDIVLYHTMVVTKYTVTLEFARTNAARNCPVLPGQPQPVPGGESPSKLLGGHHMVGVKEFDAALGPTGKADIGYQAITGMQGWGLSWWINGELIPVLHVERGLTYKFTVHGGDGPMFGAKYHPFYITDSPKGGGSKVTDQSTIGKPGHMLYAGVNFDNTTNRIDTSKGAGGFCEYKGTAATNTAETIEEFKKSVRFVCDRGAPVVFTWTPDKDTPDELYYQCYSHYYFGWKIMVHDRGKGPVVPPSPPPPAPTPKPPPTTGKPKPPAEKGAHSGESGGSGDAVRPALAPLWFACAAVLATFLLWGQARQRHA